MNNDLNLTLQTFYALCKQYVYNNFNLYEQALEKISKSEIYEDKGEPIIIKSWINTIDNMDSSLILNDTYNLFNKLASLNDKVLYLVVITELTIILNNIFYSDYKSNKSFWITNTSTMYYGLIYNSSLLEKNEIIKSSSINLDVNDYYQKFFNFFQEKCIRLGITIKLDEYFL